MCSGWSKREVCPPRDDWTALLSLSVSSEARDRRVCAQGMPGQSWSSLWSGRLSSRPAVTAPDAAEATWKDRGGGRGGAVPAYTPGGAWEAPAAGHRGATFTRALGPYGPIRIVGQCVEGICVWLWVWWEPGWGGVCVLRAEKGADFDGCSESFLRPKCMSSVNPCGLRRIWPTGPRPPVCPQRLCCRTQARPPRASGVHRSASDRQSQADREAAGKVPPAEASSPGPGKVLSSSFLDFLASCPFRC